MTSEKTQQFTKEALNHMRKRLSDYQEKYGDLYNLEATPAESTTYRLAKMDKKKYPEIITAGQKGDTPYYTNSSHLPVDFSDDIFSALDIQDELQTLYTSGTVFHGFLGEKLSGWQEAAKLVRTIAENYKLPYYTLSPTYSVCREHGYIDGEAFTCPKCGAKTEVYSRITGYYRPVQNWNEGKAQEYKNRVVYTGELEGFEAKEKKGGSQEICIDLDVENSEDGMYLFTTKTCPNCKLARDYLKNMNYETVDAEENIQLAREFGIMQAPTLVVIRDGQPKKYVNASNIKRFAETKQ